MQDLYIEHPIYKITLALMRDLKKSTKIATAFA